MNTSFKKWPLLFTSLVLPLLVIIFIFDRLPQAQAAGPTIYHVAKTGNGSDGLDWTRAFTDLQDALTLTVNGDEIWVAEGTYVPGALVTATFQLKSGVGIYGGFAATETLRTERQWLSNLTWLSGDFGGGNVYHVVTSSGVTGTAVLDGFIIHNGFAMGSVSIPCVEECGGGLYNNGGSPTLTNLYFYLNYAANQGGGIYSPGGDPTLSGITFYQNTAYYGGGMYQDGNPTLTNVTFTDNHAVVEGGGMHLHSSPTLTGVTFSENSADGHGGGIYAFGASAILSDVTFTGNMASDVNGSGGGIYANGSSLVLTDAVFEGNWALYYGGGMYNRMSNPTLDNVTFSANYSLHESGGGMANYFSNPALTNVTFSGNWANGGGGIYNMNSSDPTLTNVTVSGNYAQHVGGGMWNGMNCYPVVRNSIFWNNQDSSGIGTLSANIINDTSAVTLTHSILQGSGGSTGWTLDASYIDAGGNLDSDPIFFLPIDPATAPTTAGSLRLSMGSPAIDAGDNAYITGVPYDLDGSPRIINAVVDLGAYETFVYKFLPLIFR